MDAVNPNEEWRPVVGFEETHEVSNLGRIRSIDYIIVKRTGQQVKHRGRILNGADDRGYRFYSMSGMGKKGMKYGHHMVTDAFLGPMPEGMERCHNNGNRSDNRLFNLRYGTHSENMYDKQKHGTDHNAIKTHCKRGHILELPNLTNQSKKDGIRGCLACARANSYIRYHVSRRSDIDDIANSYYESILRKSA